MKKIPEIKGKIETEKTGALGNADLQTENLERAATTKKLSQNPNCAPQ
jgi:hypothetical protein